LTHSEAKISRTILTLAVLAIGSFLLSVSVALPEGNITYSALQNFGHFLLFAFLGWAVLLLTYRLLNQNFWKAIAITSAGLIGLGLAIELFQSTLVSRSASLNDLLLDIAGVVVGFLMFSLPLSWRQRSWLKALAMASAALAILAVTVRPVVPLVGFDLMRPPVPVIRSFDHLFSGYKIEINGGARYSRVATGEPPRCCALRMVFSTAQYSGVIFHERSARWRDYSNLSIKIFNSLPKNRQIELRINDGLHNNLYEDRYNGSFTILPGFNELSIPLSLIASMGNAELSGREMDIDDVTRIQIFTNKIESSYALDLLGMELN